jgi:hypothetical protein
MTRNTAVKKNQIILPSNQKRQRENLEQFHLERRKQFKLISSTPHERFLSKIRTLNKILINLSLAGLFTAALSYFALVNLEFEVSQNLKKLENEIKNREDLKSYLSKAYSWENLHSFAKASNLYEAKNIEVTSTNNSKKHKLFDIVH